MRLAAYGGVSTLLAASAILSAFRQRANFYAASVYLSKSNACMMILCNFGIFCTVILSKVLQSIFFGKLRSAEVERLHDRLWFTITETLLALAMFRDEFDTIFVVLFISLIFVKCFHWLAADRVEWMDQSPTPPGTMFHARMISVLSLIWITDALLIAYATESVLLRGPSVVLMFEMEYIIMQVTCLSIICKYWLNSYGQYRAQEHWEEKSTYLFYIDLATDFLKLLTYVGFLSLTVTFYGLPINVLRDVYYTARSFMARCNNLVRFRQATRNMNERYPNATREEMNALADKTCIICREDMDFHEDDAQAPAAPPNSGDGNGPNDTPKKLPCGHIFHFHCLRSWLERQQTCPTCRRPVLQSPPTNTARVAVGGAAALPQPGAAAGVLGLQGPAPPPPAVGDPGLLVQGQALPGVGQPGNMNITQTRLDLHQRLREIQQRLANSAAGLATQMNNPPNGLRLPTTSLNPQNPATDDNPLVSFHIPSAQHSKASKAAGLSASPTLQAACEKGRTNSCTSNFEKPNSGDAIKQLNNSQKCPATEGSSTPPRTSTSVSLENEDPTPASLRDESKPEPIELSSDSTPTKLSKSPPSDLRLSATEPNVPTSKLAIVGLPSPSTTTANDAPLESRFTTVGDGHSIQVVDNRLPSTSRRYLPTLADVEMPCLIPLFDTETFTLPENLKAGLNLSHAGRNRLLIDQSSVVIPGVKFVPELNEEVIKNALEGQLKVLMNVQHTLLACSHQLKTCLGVKGKAKADENEDQSAFSPP